ncbi:hypothetical protein ACT4UM_26200, partial [Bacillus sp. SS-TM]
MKLAISYNEMVKEFLGKVEGSIKIPKDVQGTELRIKRKTELFSFLSQFPSFSFDASVWESFASLFCGGNLY